jgi:hypothetical protein
MTLILAPDTPVRSVKAAFSEAFPALRLEVATRKIEQDPAGNCPERLPDMARLADVTDVALPCVLHITEASTTKDLEAWFQGNLFLVAQVFRNCGAFWVQVTDTGELSLGAQNEWAEAGM